MTFSITHCKYYMLCTIAALSGYTLRTAMYIAENVGLIDEDNVNIENEQELIKLYNACQNYMIFNASIKDIKFLMLSLYDVISLEHPPTVKQMQWYLITATNLNYKYKIEIEITNHLN